MIVPVRSTALLPVLVISTHHAASVLAGISFLKGRIFLGALSVLIPGLGLWGTIRLSKPHSPWARRFYDEQKLERARRRYPPDRFGIRFRDGFFNLIGGRPSEPDPPARTP